MLYISYESFYRRGGSAPLGQRPWAEQEETIELLLTFLSTLQTLLKSISFDRGDWANLYRVDENNYRFEYGRKPAIAGKRSWAPLIDEKDVEILTWSNQRRGS